MKNKHKIKIKNRSGVEFCDICNEPNILVVHHINGRNIENSEHASNLVSICPNCHLAVHYGRIIVEGWFLTTNGRKLIWHKKNENSITDQESNPYIVPIQKN